MTSHAIKESGRVGETLQNIQMRVKFARLVELLTFQAIAKLFSPLQASGNSEELFTDQWINFDEFCQGVASFYSPPSLMMSQNKPLPRGN